jgi:low affinity Fe/Cu permease
MNETRRLMTKLGVLTASPAAFLIVLLYAVIWFMVQPETFDLHAVATIAVWLMTLVIQRAEHRDTQAIHAKLDELIRVNKNLDNETMLIDEQEPEDIERKRQQLKVPG